MGGDIAGRITIKTFHAFGVQILREAGQQLGLSQNFTIGDEEDRRSLLKRACPFLSEAEIDRHLVQISMAKNRLLAADDPELAVTNADDFQFDPGLASVYQSYQTTLAAANMVDFDDLVMQTVRLFQLHADILQAVQARYRWISVDEYQDVNLAQYRLLRLLASAGVNICVIGDPDQAIYGFRGADRGYFLTFDQDYPGAKSYHLEQSYRSPQTLLDAAVQVIAANPDRSAVRLWSDFAEQIKLDVYQAPTDKAEAEYVVHRMEQMVGGTSYFSLDSGRVDEAEPAQQCFCRFCRALSFGRAKPALDRGAGSLWHSLSSSRADATHGPQRRA